MALTEPWYPQQESNLRLPRSKRGTLFAELWGHLVRLVGVEPTMAFAAGFVDQSLIR